MYNMNTWYIAINVPSCHDQVEWGEKYVNFFIAEHFGLDRPSSRKFSKPREGDLQCQLWTCSLIRCRIDTTLEILAYYEFMLKEN